MHLTRPLKDRPPREGDQVVLAVREGAKGAEAWDVAPVSVTSVPLKSRNRTPRKQQGKEDMQAKIYACVFTAKTLAGRDHRQLQELIPLVLQHNGLPAVYIPRSALTANTRTNTRLSRRGHPGPMGKMEDATPPSGKQEEDDGWVIKKKLRRRPTGNPWVLPKDKRITKPSIALRESPTITRLRQEKRTGKIREDVLTGVYIHEENRFMGHTKGYSGFDGYLSFPYPKKKAVNQ
ncbi:hypothetical protein E2C01_030255 [Portunus trituberculatus]|uniref:Uncharacterized protein n=1 Tax=Portunus trituberculatus TaxID=210409 RepID=A0A5B7EUD5_PORTR|nr:hypothetical protein [Portunus trituberculatus]